MSTLTLLPRILHIAGTAARYRLDDLVEDARVRHSLRTLRWFLPSPPAEVLALPRGERPSGFLMRKKMPRVEPEKALRQGLDPRQVWTDPFNSARSASARYF